MSEYCDKCGNMIKDDQNYEIHGYYVYCDSCIDIPEYENFKSDLD